MDYIELTAARHTREIMRRDEEIRRMRKALSEIKETAKSANDFLYLDDHTEVGAHLYEILKTAEEATR